MAVSKREDTSKIPVNMNEKSKISKIHNKKTYVIAQEIKLAKILAGNNKTLRDRALKRLKQWFQFRSQSTPFTDDDFMRLWKGLFYAMWMSDKPLVQEECAEMISSLVHLPTVNYSLMFFKCGLLTLGNEWFGIDQLRLDKFLMFVRRLLRQGFVILKNNSWNLKIIKQFNNILSATILNVENPPPLGLTMHFTETYMEELAKISEGNLKSHLMTEIVAPFIKHLALLNDNRQISCVLKNIFRYLIRQSEIGMEFQEKFNAWKSAGFPGKSIDSMQKQKLSDDEKMSDDEEDLQQKQRGEKILDPRAGFVDVLLPQLKFIPKQIIEVLNQNRFLEGSNTKSRKAITTLIDEFTQLYRGQYPLGIKKLDLPKKDGYSTKIKNAVNRLVKFENKLLNKNKKRKNQNQNEKNLEEPDKKKKKNENVVADNKNVDDKLAEFIEKSESNMKVKLLSKKHIKGVQKKIKNNKLTNIKAQCTFKRNSGTWIVYDEDTSANSSLNSSFQNSTITEELETTTNSTPAKNNLIATKINKDEPKSLPKLFEDQKSSNLETSKHSETPEKNNSFEVSTPQPVETALFKQNEWDIPLKEGETEIFVESKKYKEKIARRNSVNNSNAKVISSKLIRRRSLDSQFVRNSFAKLATPGSSKKVKIALNLNQSQDIHEHVAQIKSSPGIPFDANKKPSKPLLKRHTISPVDPFYKRKLQL